MNNQEEQNVILCQICHKVHDGSYGSGRFCDSKCANKSRQKNRRKTNMINRKLGVNKSKNFKPTQSKLQKRVVSILKKSGLKVQTQFRVGKYYFDIKIGNVLYEINGDFWHATPRKYKPSSIIKFPGGKKKLAINIWKKDLKKKQQAIKHGYKVVYLWQMDINRMNESQIVNFVKNHLLL